MPTKKDWNLDPCNTFQQVSEVLDKKYPDIHCCHALQHRYVYFSQHSQWEVQGLMKQRQRFTQVIISIICGNSLFHSSNSYISLCRHLELVRLTQFLCWHFQSPANEKLSLAGLPAQILLWMPEKHDGRWMPAKCARGVERRYTWQGSWERLFVFTHCSLLLFKSEDEQVLSCNGWFWSKSGQISRDTRTQRCMRIPTSMHTKSTPQSIHYFYGIFFWASFIYDTVSFASISFALCLKLVLCLIDWFHFKTHKATVVANAALPCHVSILHPHCRGYCIWRSLIPHLCRTGSRRVKVENKTFLLEYL